MMITEKQGMVRDKMMAVICNCNYLAEVENLSAEGLQAVMEIYLVSKELALAIDPDLEIESISGLFAAVRV